VSEGPWHGRATQQTAYNFSRGSRPRLPSYGHAYGSIDWIDLLVDDTLLGHLRWELATVSWQSMVFHCKTRTPLKWLVYWKRQISDRLQCLPSAEQLHRQPLLDILVLLLYYSYENYLMSKEQIAYKTVQCAQAI